MQLEESGFPTVMSVSRNPKTDFPEYEGLLAEPMPTPTPFSSQAERDEWAKTLTEKMRLLVRRFEIEPGDPNAFVKVAAKLARRHVPGFAPPPKKQGRPPERDDDCTLWMLFELLKRRDGKAGRPASQLIAATGVIEGTPETLRTRHKNWKRKNKLVIDFYELVSQDIGEQKWVDVLEETLREVLGNDQVGLI